MRIQDRSTRADGSGDSQSRLQPLTEEWLRAGNMPSKRCPERQRLRRTDPPLLEIKSVGGELSERVGNHHDSMVTTKQALSRDP